MPKPVRRGKKGLISVDFTGVESGGGGGRLLPEGTYQFELVEIEEQESENSGKPYLAAVMKVADGEYEGAKAYENFSLQPQALWKLRSFLEAAGHPTEDGPMELDPDELIGLVASADVIHEEYKGKTKHRINAWLVESTGEGEGGEAEVEEERPGPKKRTVNGVTKKSAQSEWKVKDAVSFKEGKKTITGVITQIEDDNVTVKVGRDEYEMSVDDLQAA